jgi:hypothetical protein
VVFAIAAGTQRALHHSSYAEQSLPQGKEKEGYILNEFTQSSGQGIE